MLICWINRIKQWQYIVSPTPLHLKHNYQFQERKRKIGKKPQNEKLMQKNFEKGGACVIYRSTLGGIPVANDYRPDIYGFLLDHIEEETLNIYFTNLQILFALSTCKQMFYWESQGPRSQLLLLIRPQIVLFSNVCFACL